MMSIFFIFLPLCTFSFDKCLFRYLVYFLILFFLAIELFQSFTCFEILQTYWTLGWKYCPLICKLCLCGMRYFSVRKLFSLTQFYIFLLWLPFFFFEVKSEISLPNSLIYCFSLIFSSCSIRISHCKLVTNVC